MKICDYILRENEALAPGVYRMRLEGDCSAVSGPGQFVNLKLEGLYLRRPISVADAEEGLLTLIYKAVGRGTEQMSRLKPGTSLEIMSGLGNGYDLSLAGEAPLLLGGGLGAAPLYYLARKLREAGKPVKAVLGFNKASEVICEEEFRALGCGVTVTTVDGSCGTQGFVTDALPESFSYYYTCGPLPMLKAVYRQVPGSGSFSLEERMGCGFGACMGCSCETLLGPKRICKDGPVFLKEVLPWDA